MKPQSLTALAMVSLVALVTTIATPQPASAQVLSPLRGFSCVPPTATDGLPPEAIAPTENGDIPVVLVALPKRGNPIPIIRWSSNTFSRSGYTPQFRCEAVAARFQKFYSCNILSNIIDDRDRRILVGVDGATYPAIEVSTIGSTCPDIPENGRVLLFMLEPDMSPENTQEVLDLLGDIRAGIGRMVCDNSTDTQPICDRDFEPEVTFETPSQ